MASDPTCNEPIITHNVLITIVRATDLARRGIINRQPYVFVEITLSQLEDCQRSYCHRTTAKYSTSPIWNESFPLIGVDGSSLVSFEVIDSFGGRCSLGIVKRTVKSLLELAQHVENIAGGSITISVQQESENSKTVATALTELRKKADRIAPAELSESGFTVSQSLDKIVKSLEKFVDIIDSFAQIHPYAHAAWKTVSFVYDVIKAQLDRDKSILDLVTTMETLYSFVSPLEALVDEHQSVLMSLENVIKAILNQTIECVLFIQEYAGHGFAGKAIYHSLSTADGKIGEFRKSFADLGRWFDTGVGVQTSLVSLRIGQRVDEIAMHARLSPVEMNWTSRPRCHPKTRLNDIKMITEWVLNGGDKTSHVLWLVGLAGTGKSTLATTLASFFADLGRLGAFVFYDRDVRERSEPSNVIRTLAYELARFDSRISKGVMWATDKNVHIAQMHLDAQFSGLIKQPLESSRAELSKEGPIVVIIDALDECGTVASRKDLLTLLANATSDLPINVRIIITSRGVPDIKKAFQSKSHIRIEEPVSEGTGDIEIFIRHELSEIAVNQELEKDWLQPEKITKLVDRAGGLWIWAATACRYIDSYQPVELVDALVADNAGVDLDGLFIKALESPKWSNHLFRSHCCDILGLILLVKDPLSPSAIDCFLKLNSYNVIRELGSVLHYQGDSEPVRILHASFRDFLSKSSDRNDPWLIDLTDHNERLAERCIEIMERAFAEDKFRHLMLGDTYNDQTVNEPTAYACSYWIVHLCEMEKCTSGFKLQLQRFVGINFLHWLEAMSMLGRARHTVGLLDRLANWVHKFVQSDETLCELVDDGCRFAWYFTDTIAFHPSLVCLSALHFAPLHSKIYEIYHNDHSPTILGGYQKQWPRSLRAFQCKDKSINSLALSPDGSKIMSSGIIDDSDYDKGKPGLRLWDVMTGTEVVPVLKIDDESVVTFSIDGSKIWSASKRGTMLTLNAATGQIDSTLSYREWARDRDYDAPAMLDQRRLRNHKRVDCATLPDLESSVGEVVTLRSTGEGIVSHGKKMPATWEGTSVRSNTVAGSSLLTLSGMNISADLDGSSTQRVLQARKKENQTFSPNFKRAVICPRGLTVVFGSENGSLHVIDIAGRREKYPALKSAPLKPRELERMFHSIDFSPDGSQFASGSGNGTIYVWNTAAGQESVVELQGHKDEVTALAYSKDGRTLVSSSEDGLIRTWDVVKATVLHEVQVDHSEFQPMGISPDGTRVVSTSLDGTLHFWGVTSGIDIGPLLQGHFNSVSAVTFSADGSRLVSGAFLNNIRIWDITLDGKSSTKIQRHDRPPHKVTFSPDGLRVRSWRPNVTKFWDTITGNELEMHPYHHAADFVVSEEDPNSVMVKSPAGDTIVLTEAQSDKVWQKPEDSGWVSALSSAAAIPGVMCSDDGEVTADGWRSVIWRLPLEFKHRCHAHHGNFLAIGTWDGRVLVVYLPDAVLYGLDRIPVPYDADGDIVEDGDIDDGMARNVLFTRTPSGEPRVAIPSSLMDTVMSFKSLEGNEILLIEGWQ